jgi:hypothetical protein
MRSAIYGKIALVALLCLLSVCSASNCRAEVVDEPFGARYSLGMTLWHLGHNADMIGRFHDYVKSAGLTPEKALAVKAMKPPANMLGILIEPELLGRDKLGGWDVNGDYIVSGAGDAGPTVSIPLVIPRAGFYRLWVKYLADTGSRGVTSVKIYREGKEDLGPVCQPDEFYDQLQKESGLQWKDMLVDLPQGRFVIKLGHVTRWWHGDGGYAMRSVDCIYLTDEVWETPPDPQSIKAMRDSSKPADIQWTVKSPLNAAGLSQWKWWQVRPLSWEDAASNPKLFTLSRKFQNGIVDELARKEYDEAKKPDYREPERQVVFNDTWNMVANPVRMQRQINILNSDISRKPLGYNYVWHDVGSNIEGLKAEGGYDAGGPYAKYGGWYGGPGELGAGYGTGTGTVATNVPVAAPGKYSVWVLSSSTNLSYTAPWYGKVSADGREQLTYYHKGNIPSIWMKMGEVEINKPGDIKVEFTLDGAEFGTTYRRIYTLFLIDDPNYTPQGTIRPPWDINIYNRRAAQAGAAKVDKLLLWISDNPYRPISQEVWSEKISSGDSWPYTPQKGTTRTKEIYMPRDSCRAVRVAVRGLVDTPIALDVKPGPLKGTSGSFANAVTWRVESFVPYGNGRQEWTPVFLLRRPSITVPPLNVAGIWLTVNTKDVPAGNYQSVVKISGKGIPAYTVVLKVRVSPVKPEPKKPVLIDGWTQPHEGLAHMQDFIDHGMNVWPGEMSKADMKKWGIRLIRLSAWSAQNIPEFIARLKTLGLDYDDYFVGILDEPGGTTEESLKPYLDVAKAIRAADPRVRICFNPSESAELATFQLLAPYCDLWCPYVKHIFSPYWGNPEKKAIYQPKPWMWYTTPDLWDKTARDPGIRTVSSQPGNCIGVAFFAMNYPWRDQWDTAYEHFADASTMGAVQSRNGPVATIVWEQIREVSQTANLAMMVRERLGVKTFDEVTDPKMQQLIREGTDEELLSWLEKSVKK